MNTQWKIYIALWLIKSAFGENLSPQPSYIPGQVIVKFKQAPQAVAPASWSGSSVAFASVEPLMSLTPHLKGSIDPRTFFLASFSESVDPQLVAAELAADPRVEYAQPNFIYKVQAVPNDPDYAKQPFWQQISAPSAWDITQGDSAVVIAVMDTGVDYEHEDLRVNIWNNKKEKADGKDNDGNGKIDDIRGWDFVNGAADAAAGEDGQAEDNDPMDVHGHGTHVAGLASAATNNGVGGAGMGWKCKIMPLRVGYKNKNGGGSIISSAVLSAIEYAVDHKVAVINQSFGGRYNDFASRDMLRYAFESGVVVVKAAGNDNSDFGYTPDTEDWLLSVAAVDGSDQKASYSNFGRWVKISAPGGTPRVGVYSTFVGNSYRTYYGTSMAAPIVSGAAALVRSEHPDWSAAQVMMHIVDTADNIDAANPLYAGKLGAVGRVNAFRAVTAPYNSQPHLRIARVSIEDLVTGNGDQRVNVGETTDLMLRITNVWQAATNVQLELSTGDPQVTVVRSKIIFAKIPGIESWPNFVDTRDPYFTVKVDERAFPHNIPFKLTATSGSYRQVIEFHVAVEARLLLVDDDDGTRNIERYYQAELDSLGMPYDLWDRALQGRIGARMKNYDMVIWACENAFPTLNSEDREDITNYLRGKKALMIAGQNIAWDLCAQQTQADVDERGYRNQYSFDAKSFYETHLRAEYVEDKTGYSMVRGVNDAPLSRGLEFPFFQPQRTPEEQSPDVIKAKNAKPLFTYPDGNVAAVFVNDRSSKLVNLAFGGLEAIPDSTVRRRLAARLLYEFTGMEVTVGPLQNIEMEHERMYLGATVKSSKALQGVYLYWRSTVDPAFEKIAMTAVNDTTFYADLPRRPQGVELEYGVQAVADDGFYSPIKLTRVKIESGAPTVFAQMPRLSSLSLSPFLTMTAFDVSGLDAGSARVHFRTMSIAEDSSALAPLNGTVYGGTVRGPFNYGDTLYYRFTIRDRSPLKLRGESPLYKMLLGFEGFEFGLTDWDSAPGGWGVNGSRARSGSFAAHSNPEQAAGYPNNADLSLTLVRGLDLSRLSQATLSAWMFYGFSDDDYGLVEASADSGVNWRPLGLPITGAAAKYYKAEFDLSDFTDAGNEDVRVRFRLISNGSGAGPGWFIDDLEILPIRTTVAKADELPRTLQLHDAYPNPFNAQTVIRYALPQVARVRLTVINTLGQQLAVLEDGVKSAGSHSVGWNGTDAQGLPAPSGLYFYRLQTGDAKLVKKMMLLR